MRAEFTSVHCENSNHVVCMVIYGGRRCTCFCHDPGHDARDFNALPGQNIYDSVESRDLLRKIENSAVVYGSDEFIDELESERSFRRAMRQRMLTVLPSHALVEGNEISFVHGGYEYTITITKEKAR